MEEKDILALHPLRLAYIGDAVYDLYVKKHEVESGLKLKAVHQCTTKLVRASSQAKLTEILRPHLTEEEEDIIRKGRNAQAKHSAPKSASSAEYSMSTGLEALIGFLHLTGRDDRAEALFDIIFAHESEV